MSGKFSKTKTKKKKHTGLWIALALALALLLAVILLVPSQPKEESYTSQTVNQGGMQVVTSKENKGSNLSVLLRDCLEIQSVGGYTGTYMEDGTDELVTDVLMLKVVNVGEEAVEYAKITMKLGDETAEFALTTLQPGATVILLEKNRMAYDKSVNYRDAEVTCDNLALFDKPLSLNEDKISIQTLKGAINVTNISGEDISGRITVYYKNMAAGIYYGGITYRITLEDGLKAGEIRQIMASHFNESGSEILFVNITQ